MTTKKINFKQLIRALARRSNDTALTISLVLIILVAVFLYSNFYQSLENIKILTALKSQVATKVVNMDAWQKINEQLEIKKQPLGEWQNGYIPF
jgi:membrane protein involved in colicin uptake